MSLLDLRERAGYLFLVVVVGHVILISAQITSRSGVPLLEVVTFGAVAEVQRAASAAVGGLRNIWGGYVDLRSAQAENRRLQEALAALQVQMQEQGALVGRVRGLEALLELKEHQPLSTTGARIIASGATPDFRTVTIDKGLQQGLTENMAVLAPAGIVGRVVVPSARAAKVQLLIDRNAAAGAMIERSRAQGVVVGVGDDTLRLDYVSELSDVAVGDRVVTAGTDGIYPKGLVIGNVSGVEKSGTAYREIRVQPAVDFGSLEDVLVILTPTEAAAAAAAEASPQ